MPPIPARTVAMCTISREGFCGWRRPCWWLIEWCGEGELWVVGSEVVNKCKFCCIEWTVSEEVVCIILCKSVFEMHMLSLLHAHCKRAVLLCCR